MDTAGNLNFDSVCRTCMNAVAEDETFSGNTAKQSEIQCHSMSETVEECGTMQIVELLSTTTPQLQVNLRDELPQKICRKCFQLLLSVYRFQQICMQSEHQMREILAKRYADAKLMSTTLSESLEEEQEFALTEDKREGVDTKALNNALEVPEANDPLQNEEFIKMEEFIDEDVNNDEDKRGASVASINLADIGVIIDLGTPTTANETDTMGDELSSSSRFNTPESKYIDKQAHTAESGNNKKTYDCDLCDNTYNSKSGMRYHKAQKHAEKPSTAPVLRHICEICSKGKFNF